MSLVTVSDVSFGYAGDPLFAGVTFTLQAGERVGLVAPNGAGKSSLLRLVSGELEPDQGTVTVESGKKIAYYRQSHELRAEGTILRALLASFGEVLRLRDELATAQKEAASGSADALARLSYVTDRYHQEEGDALERKVGTIATKLGFSDLERDVSTLSGGERGRLQLGVALAEEASLLLLDEPTNHLDLDTIAWLESHLRAHRGALLVISHDRQFLDNTVSRTLELGEGGIRSYNASYSEYAVLREADLARERALAGRQKAMVEKTEDFIRRNIAGQKTKQAQSRRRMLEKLDRVEQPDLQQAYRALGRVRAFRTIPPEVGTGARSVCLRHVVGPPGAYVLAIAHARRVEAARLGR